MDTYTSIHGMRSQSRASRALRTAAVLLTAVALICVLVAALTFRYANATMRREPKVVENFSSNVMPGYSIVGFKSLDGTALSGWFFPAKGTPRGTVVMVHGDSVNRLQFGDATPALYKSLVDRKFNVLSFDLRHSGDSEGRLTTYGYDEWEDVLAAVDYARKTTTTTGVVLYGFGSGAGAALAAWEQLPATEADRNEVPSSVAALPLLRDYVLAMMLDGPLDSPDDSIRLAMDRLGLPSFFPFSATVPLAVRLSAGASSEYPLAALASRFQRPMLVLEPLPADGKRSILLAERLRLQPETTTVYEKAVDGSSGATLYGTDPKAYQAELTEFLDQYFP